MSITIAEFPIRIVSGTARSREAPHCLNESERAQWCLERAMLNMYQAAVNEGVLISTGTMAEVKHEEDSDELLFRVTARGIEYGRIMLSAGAVKYSFPVSSHQDLTEVHAEHEQAEHEPPVDDGIVE